MEIKYKTKYHKTKTICQWKYIGVVYDDFEELYYIYMNTLNCSHCNKDFKTTLDRCLDHDHSTGLFRAIVCQNCNKNDSYIKYPNGYYKNKDYHKEYYQANKEKMKEYDKKYHEANKEKMKVYKKKYDEKNNKNYDCDCGGKYTNKHKQRHLRTIKHIAWFMEQVD